MHRHWPQPRFNAPHVLIERNLNRAGFEALAAPADHLQFLYGTCRSSGDDQVRVDRSPELYQSPKPFTKTSLFLRLYRISWSTTVKSSFKGGAFNMAPTSHWSFVVQNPWADGTPCPRFVKIRRAHGCRFIGLLPLVSYDFISTEWSTRLVP